jgi:hypothetical protein
MGVQVWHLVIGGETRAEVESWLRSGALVTGSVELPRPNDFVFLCDAFRRMFAVGVVQEARFAADGVVDARIAWARIRPPAHFVGASRRRGLSRANAHAGGQRIIARQWFEGAARKEQTNLLR